MIPAKYKRKILRKHAKEQGAQGGINGCVHQYKHIKCRSE
jgi:hypothetical protein